MRIRLARLSVLAALVVPVGIMGVSTASASADTLNCTENTGTVKLSPGLSSKEQVQNVIIHGTLAGCSGEGTEVTSGTYTAHLKTTGAVSCATLATASEATGTVVLKWPSGNGNSHASLSMQLVEGAATLGGLVNEEEGKLFSGDTISGSVAEAYTNAAKCGVAEEGKKKAAKIKNGTVSGTLSIS